MKSKILCSYPVLCINFKGAILVIWVSTAVFVYLTFLAYIALFVYSPDNDSLSSSLHFYSLLDQYFVWFSLTLLIFLPLFGWILFFSYRMCIVHSICYHQLLIDQKNISFFKHCFLFI